MARRILKGRGRVAEGVSCTLQRLWALLLLLLHRWQGRHAARLLLARATLLVSLGGGAARGARRQPGRLPERRGVRPVQLLAPAAVQAAGSLAEQHCKHSAVLEGVEMGSWGEYCRIMTQPALFGESSSCRRCPSPSSASEACISSAAGCAPSSDAPLAARPGALLAARATSADCVSASPSISVGAGRKRKASGLRPDCAAPSAELGLRAGCSCGWPTGAAAAAAAPAPLASPVAAGCWNGAMRLAMPGPST